MNNNIKRTKDRTDLTDEVFTPWALVNHMLDKIGPIDDLCWTDTTKKYLEPSAGEGNFLEALLLRLMYTLKNSIPDEKERKKHILENMIFAIDIMPDNVLAIHDKLGYFIGGKQNPDLDHFASTELTHDYHGKETGTNICFIHHRNIVCANSLEYDFSFGRKPDGSEYTEEELKLKERQKNLLEM